MKTELAILIASDEDARRISADASPTNAIKSSALRHLPTTRQQLSLVYRPQKRQRPSRSDGGCCEKGVPSSGEKIVFKVQLSDGGGGV
jgi:hypothetical protein